MTTKTISFHECRSNLSKLRKEARAENCRYIVLVHGKPAFMINPLPGEVSLEEVILATHDEYEQAESSDELFQHVFSEHDQTT